MKKRYIIIYPYKFVDTLYTIMGLDGFSDETEILVLDISIILNKKFSDCIAASQTLQKIRKVQSLRQFIIEISDIKKQSSNKITCVNYRVPLNSLKALFINILCFFYFKNTQLKFLTTINPGLPYFKSKSLGSRIVSKIPSISSLGVFIKIMNGYIWSKIPSPMNFLETHKLIAGSHYILQELNKKKNIKLIKGHCFDYDRYLSSISQNTKCKDRNTIIFLDEPGPLFKSDYALTGDKVQKTIDTWYPSLCKFFDHLEATFNARVIIAAHYKSAFTSSSDFFGGREVLYGQTRELIENSKLVVTEQSSAVSFAIIYNKPILFIYSDESKNDLQLMCYIENISDILGQPVCNINRLKAIPKTLPIIETNKYLNYKDQFLTFAKEARTNAQLIEQEVLT